MSDGLAFHGEPGRGDAFERRVAAVVATLVVGLLVVAIAKPWGGPAPGPTPAPTTSAEPSIAVASPIASAAPNGPLVAPAVAVSALPIAFAVPAPPPASARWTGLSWREVDPTNPLSLVTSVVRWRRGFVALGRIGYLPATPVWTSADGATWDPLPFDTPTTFWSGNEVLGVAQVPTGLVAFTEGVTFCGVPCVPTYILPLTAWTSTDGRSWSPHMLPPEWLAGPMGVAPLIAAGPAGLIIATSGPHSRLATSVDAVHWRQLAADAFPARFAVRALAGISSGYIAAGSWGAQPQSAKAATIWSTDGRTWPTGPVLLPAPTAESGAAVSTVDSLVSGEGGVVAMGGSTADTPGDARWWQSEDGLSWQPVAQFSPLGPSTCRAELCSRQPSGVMAGDGARLVAIRGGSPGTAAWTSADGQSWQRLAMSGSLPGSNLVEAALLPGGVLVSDGSSWWIGTAVVH